MPIQGGVRLTGKVGRQDVGVLSVRSDGVDALGLDPAWYNVARVRRDLGGRSYVGGIVTDSRRDGTGSTTLGADGEWFFTDSLLLRGSYLAVDDDDDPTAAPSSYGTALDLTTDPWGFLFGYTLIEDGFAPDLGYVQRDGIRRYDASLRRSIRPGRWGIRRVSFRTFDNWYDSLVHDDAREQPPQPDLRGRARERRRPRVGRQSQLRAAVRAVRARRRPRRSAAGEYTYTSAELQYHSDESRRWGVDAEATVGEFFDGDSTQLEAGAWWVLSRHFRVAASYSTYDVSADHGGIDWRLWSVRLEYIHSATISASAYLQHNSSNGTTVVNLRLRWILPNDSDLFLVLNERRDEQELTQALRSRDAALKVSYRFFL